MERLLALGSVVKVQVEEEATARLMIAGYLPQDEDTGQIFDYVTVLYPFGMQQVPAIQMIRQDQILEVEAEGYLDERAAAFTKQLPELIEKIAGEARRMILEAAREEKAVQAKETAWNGKASQAWNGKSAQAKEAALNGKAAQGMEAAQNGKAVQDVEATRNEEATRSGSRAQTAAGRPKPVDPLKEFG